MGSTSNASAKDGERTRNMQRHVALASVSVSASYNYKLYKDSVELAKRSQKLLCSPAVDLPLAYEAPLDYRAGCRMLNAAAERGTNGLGLLRAATPSLAVCVARRVPSHAGHRNILQPRGARGNTDDQDKLGVQPSHQRQRRQHCQRRSPRHHRRVVAIAPCAGRSVNWLIHHDRPPYLPPMTFHTCELRPTLRFWIGFCLAAASLLSLGFAHADPADDSLRLYAVDIWQDPPQSWGPGRGVYLGKGLVTHCGPCSAQRSHQSRAHRWHGPARACHQSRAMSSEWI